MPNAGTVRVLRPLGCAALVAASLYATATPPHLPIAFTAIPRQLDPEILFTAQAPDRSLKLKRNGAVIHGKSMFQLKWLGANPRPEVRGEGRLPGSVSYFLGSDPKAWSTGLKQYREVRFREIYPGVDLLFHTRNGQFEYDWIVSPEADPSAIRLQFPGAETVRLDSNGDLLVRAQGEELRQRRPLISQSRAAVEGTYVLGPKGLVSFRIGPYDRAKPLVIDPVLAYSTLLGGSAHDGIFGVAVDRSGAAYVAGLSASADLPAAPAGLRAPKKPANAPTAFIAKLNPAGTELVYLAYLGGSGQDVAMAVAVDDSGAAYITGGTSSPDFPTTRGAAQASYGGTGGSSLPPLFQPSGDAFIAKLSPAGDALLFSTFLGGPGKDQGYGIAIDMAGAAYVAGVTGSDYLPGAPDRFPVTAQAFQSKRPGFVDGFVAKLNPAGTAFSYVTFLGGGNEDYVFGLAVDSAGAAYVTGVTVSRDFPVTSAAAQTNVTGAPMAFAAKLNPAGDGLGWSSYLGGSRYNAAYGIAVDPGGSAYVTGVTNSPDFPATPGAFAAPKRAGNSLGDVFVAKFNPAGDSLAYSSVFGGLGSDYGAAIAVDNAGRAYITGRSVILEASNFPTTADALQRCGANAAFVAQLDADGSTLLYSSHLGGSAFSAGSTIGLGSDGSVWVAGSTSARDFPLTPGAIQSANQGPALGGFDSDSLFPYGGDGFVSKIDLSAPAPLTLSCVINAASFVSRTVSPGTVIELLGGGMGPETGMAGTVTNGRFDTSLAGTRVFFDGIPAPLLYTQTGQINTVVPYAVRAPSTEIQVEYQGETSNTITIPVVDATPGMFTADGSGIGQGLIFNEDGGLNSPANPAKPGSAVTAWVTGLGQTDPAGEDGKVNSEQSVPKLPVSVFFAGQEVEVRQASAITGQVAGVFGVTFVIPAQTPPSDTARVIVVLKSPGIIPAQDSVTMAVR